MSESAKPSRRQISLPRFQFSLGWLLIVVTVICLLLGLADVFDGLIQLVIGTLLWCAIPTPLVICTVYGRGDYQAFSIGGLIPWVSAVFGTPQLNPFGLGPLVLIIPSAVCGILAVATRRWVVRRAGQ
jgi:hypothetical protein